MQVERERMARGSGGESALQPPLVFERRPGPATPPRTPSTPTRNTDYAVPYYWGSDGSGGPASR